MQRGEVRGVLPERCLPCREGRSCDCRGRGGSSAVSHGKGEGEQLPGSDNAAGGGRPGSCARVLPQQEPSATKPSSAFPISHSGLTFQQLPLRAGFTSSLRGASAVQLGMGSTAAGWRGTAWHGMARHSTAQHGTARPARCTAAQAAWCSLARRGTARHGTVQPGTASCSPAQHAQCTLWHQGLTPLQHTALFAWLWGQGSPLAAISWCLLYPAACSTHFPACSLHRTTPQWVLSPLSAPWIRAPPGQPPPRAGVGALQQPLGQSSRKREKRLVRKPRGCSGLQVGGRKRVLKIQQRLHGPRRWLSRWRVSAATWAPADGSRGSPLRSPSPGPPGGGDGEGTVGCKRGGGSWGCTEQGEGEATGLQHHCQQGGEG